MKLLSGDIRQGERVEIDRDPVGDGLTFRAAS